MLYEAHGITKIVIACGYTDLRRGIEGLSAIIQSQYHLDPYENNVLFLFCGRRSDRIKGLLWEGNGFLLLYKRLEGGSFSWPRTPEKAVSISKNEFRLLMKGLDPVHPRVYDIKSPASAY